MCIMVLQILYLPFAENFKTQSRGFGILFVVTGIILHHSVGDSGWLQERIGIRGGDLPDFQVINMHYAIDF